MKALQDICQKIVSQPGFHRTVIGLIIFAGILAGIETDAGIKNSHRDLLRNLDLFVIFAFTLELVLKLVARGRQWSLFFRDPWNLFDFGIVAVCWLPVNSTFAPVLRLARVIRVLRLIPNVPQLQILVGALLKSIPPMSYIALLLLLLFYVYAVIGVTLFGQNDPVHFGNLPTAMLTLFQVATLENWSHLLRIQMVGSAQFGYENMRHLIQQSSAQPFAAIMYFVTFIMFGTMIILNLLIGVIVNSMSDARIESETEARERHQRIDGHPTVEDEINQAEQQITALQKQLHVIRSRLNRK